MKSLICGISGQDGAYLAQYLLSKGNDVWGTSRDANLGTFGNLRALGIFDKIKMVTMVPTDNHSVLDTIKSILPDEIYFLAGQSSVALSFQKPGETIEGIMLSVLNLLEAVRVIDMPIKIYNSSSSESFGNTPRTAANEETPFNPCSPYGIAKASAHWLVSNYRKSYGIYACNGIMFNHESIFRPPGFVTRKIVSSACRIAKGSTDKLSLGRIDIVRDWGWAPEYVEAMWLMLQQPTPDDFVIATGEANSLESFVSFTFETLNLDWKKHVVLDSSLKRPSDILWSQGDPRKAETLLGWKISTSMHGVIKNMISEEMRQLSKC